MMGFMFRSNILIAFIFWVNVVYCMYEDQAGKFDWRRQYVGKASFVDFDQSTSSGKRILVATEQNVLAALQTRNGEIGWRQILEAGEAGRVDHMLQQGPYLVLVSGGGYNVRCFNPTLGSLVWEANPLEEPSSIKATMAVTGKHNEVLAVVADNSVFFYDVETGEEASSKELPNSDTVTYKMVSHLEDDQISVIGFATNSHVAIVTAKVSGQIVSQKSVPAAWVSPDTSCLVVAGSHLVCLDSRTSTLQYVALKNPGTFKTTLLQDLGLQSGHASLVAFQQSQVDRTETEFLIRLAPSHMAVLTLSTTTGVIKVAKDLPKVSAAQIAHYDDKKTILALSRTDGEDAEVKAYELTSGAELKELELRSTIHIHHGNPLHMNALLFRKKDGTTAVRIVVEFEDHAILLIQQSGKVAWTREEALASILDVEMVDLPVSHIQAKMEDEFGSNGDDILGLFFKRFSSQFAQFKEFLIQLKNKLKTPKHHHDHVTENDEDDEEEDDEYMTRDSFNLHKLIIAATSAGKLYGIDGPTGRIYWRTFLSDLVPFHKYGRDTMKLYTQRTTAHFPHLPQAVVVGRHKVTGQGLLFAFNPIGGQPVDDMPSGGMTLNYNIQQVTMISQMDEKFLHPVVILDSNLEYHVFPKESERLVQQLAPSIFMFVTDVDSGMLYGYNLRPKQGKLVGEEMWSVNLQKDAQTITNVVAKRPAEHVHSQGIVLGDRSVLYKYLNPNLVVVTTEGLDSTQKAFLNIHLVDAVSGQVVFHCNHKRSKGPVHVVHSENWVVYNYWNQKLRRMEMAVLELYEGTKQSNATVFSSLTPPPPPLVMRQSYIFPGYLSSMEATITEKGITNKHLLIALQTGGILELPKALIDARRPIEMTQDHKEEGLIPYMPELPRPFEATINYNNSVYNIRSIYTAPAGLESTCLVLCYGLDLFYTRVNPSKMFDVLKDDFDYLFISSVLLGMILVSVITQKLAVKKALNRAWR